MNTNYGRLQDLRNLMQISTIAALRKNYPNYTDLEDLLKVYTMETNEYIGNVVTEFGDLFEGLTLNKDKLKVNDNYGNYYKNSVKALIRRLDETGLITLDASLGYGSTSLALVFAPRKRRPYMVDFDISYKDQLNNTRYKDQLVARFIKLATEYRNYNVQELIEEYNRSKDSRVATKREIRKLIYDTGTVFEKVHDLTRLSNYKDEYDRLFWQNEVLYSMRQRNFEDLDVTQEELDKALEYLKGIEKSIRRYYTAMVKLSNEFTMQAIKGAAEANFKPTQVGANGRYIMPDIIDRRSKVGK